MPPTAPPAAKRTGLNLHWPRFPIRRRAIPGLAGLTVVRKPGDPPDAASFFAWTAADLVGGNARIIYPSNPDGSRATLRGRPLQLTASTVRGCAAARLAQQRAIRNELRSRTLAFVETFDPSVGEGRFFFFGGMLLLVGWIAFVVFCVISVPQQVSSLPSNLRVLTYVAAAGFALALLKGPGVYLWFGLQLRSCNVRSLAIASDYFEAHLVDNRTERRAWRDLRRESTKGVIHILTFRDGLELRIYNPRRTAAVVKLMQTSPSLPARDRPLSSAQFIRVCVWSVLGGIAAAALISCINGQGLGAGVNPIGAFIGTSVIYPTFILVSAFGEPWLMRRFESWRPRKRGPRITNQQDPPPSA